ncbi:hypothetical protein [Leuconostoc mesenteroides]|nr:hypothetical protein [Leuconostoc mesenteroides]
MEKNIEYFEESGKEVKGEYVRIDNERYYFDKG